MGSLLTIACLPAILITPNARVTVTTIGRPSGIAATARLRRERGAVTITHLTLFTDLPSPHPHPPITHLTPTVNMVRRCLPCNHPSNMIPPMMSRE